MSSSIASSGIFLSDMPEQIKQKIIKHAFSGGGKTLEEHRKNGANLEVDVSYQLLRYFMKDDEELARIGVEYSSGRMLTSEVKRIAVQEIQKLVANFQTSQSKLS